MGLCLSVDGGWANTTFGSWRRQVDDDFVSFLFARVLLPRRLLLFGYFLNLDFPKCI